MIYNSNKQGFTLIELLVVMAIIGILASVVLSSLSTAKANARDTVRLRDMRQIEIALELFFNDNRRFPDFANDGVSEGGEFIGIGDDIDDALIQYLDPVPVDPLHDGVLYFYGYDPLHAIDLDDCSLTASAVSPWPIGIPQVEMYGFNKAEMMVNLPKETCIGTNMNFDDGDYNQAPRV